MIQLEGPYVRLRKIITSRSQLPRDVINGDYINSSGAAVGDEIFENGQKVENLPRQFDYQPQVAKINQILSS